MAKIMLVEDDNNLREIYEARLLAEGYEIVAAKDGEEALAMAVKEKPDLIISDVMMPKISGFDMLDILRSTPETKYTKVIMMTALSQAEDKARADKLGADRYLVKSQVTLEDVARVAREVLAGEPQNGAPAAAGVPVSASSPAIPAPAQQLPTPVVPAPAPDSAQPVPVATTPIAAAPEPASQPQPVPAPAPDPLPTPAAPAPAPAPGVAPPVLGVPTPTAPMPEPITAPAAPDPAVDVPVPATAEAPAPTEEPIIPADALAALTALPETPTADAAVPAPAATPAPLDASAPAVDVVPTDAAPAEVATPDPTSADSTAAPVAPAATAMPELADAGFGQNTANEEAAIDAQIDAFVQQIAPTGSDTPAQSADAPQPVPTAPAPAPATEQATMDPNAAYRRLSVADAPAEQPAAAPPAFAIPAAPIVTAPMPQVATPTNPNAQPPTAAVEPPDAPSIAGKKIISPLSDPTARPDLKALLEKETDPETAASIMGSQQTPADDPNHPNNIAL